MYYIQASVSSLQRLLTISTQNESFPTRGKPSSLHEQIRVVLVFLGIGLVAEPPVITLVLLERFRGG
ncbi:MAG: hypothetical protein JXM71_03715, partial [Spirochaetales bacterium]|nr:hypothetical protein [Spirochaetales bacterium]